MKARIKLIGSKYMKNGVEFLKIDRCDVRIKADSLHVFFDNLFNGQKVLEKTANDVINQNIDIITSEVYPIIEQVLSEKLSKMSNIVFSAAPFNEFFPLK